MDNRNTEERRTAGFGLITSCLFVETEGGTEGRETRRKRKK